MTGALVLYGAVLSVLGLYITLPARLAENIDYYEFELLRPALIPFLRVSIASVLSGVLLAGFFAYILSARLTRRHRLLRWGFIGLLYGAALPFVTGLFIPVAGELVDLLTGQARLQGFLRDLLFAVLGTPMFAAVYGILGIYVGLLGGLLLAAGGWLIEVLASSGDHRAAAYGPVVSAVVLSLLVAFPVLFGPFSIFKSLVQTWAMQ